MNFNHTIKQKLVFYRHINQCIENPHLSLYIKELKKGQDAGTLHYVKLVPPFTGLKQSGYELLMCYGVVVGEKSRFVHNALNEIEVDLDEENWVQLKDNLEHTLKKLNLPYETE